MQEWGVSPETIPGDGSNSICAEIWALRGSLRMALHIGLQFLIVELDAQTLIRRFIGFKMQYIYREGNFVADGLARLATDKFRNNSIIDQNILYFESPPAEVISSLLADAMGISNPRDVCINAAYIAPG
ncbi:hypothetical protein CDL15_Pgr027963 [Punica granatum]|uniref:RNase H type-1 domain-containing protein n=1 Tax=Punica granatum TaxID=22663 RepID=A0A218XKE6_PUNGR|nr:hypothetical protein CDL15_Pgr027963 [Punica granatum]